VVKTSFTCVSVIVIVFGSPQYTPESGYGHLGSGDITLVRTEGAIGGIAEDFSGPKLDVADAIDKAGRVEEGWAAVGFTVFVSVLMMVDVMVISRSADSVGDGLGPLAVTVI
jgi:hypothetical protein